jgi:hypothetical protein
MPTPPSAIISINPRIIRAKTNQIIDIYFVKSIQSGYVLNCMFRYYDSLNKVDVNIITKTVKKSDNIMYCITPSLPPIDVGIIMLSLIQNNNTVYGPTELYIQEQMNMENVDVYPTSLMSGILTTIYISFQQTSTYYNINTPLERSMYETLKINPNNAAINNKFTQRLKCILNEMDSPVYIVNRTYGFCIVQPMHSGTFDLQVRLAL